MNRPHRRGRRIAAVCALSATVAFGALAAPTSAARPDRNERSFQHVGTFDVSRNGNEVAEIVDATKDGKQLVYTDSATGSVGFVDIANPSDPQPAGRVEVGGSPTSVGITKRHILVAVDTSDGDFIEPSGQLVVLDVTTRAIVATLPLGGQPDSVAISPNERYAAVVLENQRDEEENDGLIPQLPAGQLVVIDLHGSPTSWPLRHVDFTGLPMLYNDDPEPEYVDINDNNLAVVSLQENNHLAVVDLRNGAIVSNFSAGTVDLTNVDATEDELGPQGNGIISLTDSIEDRRREPDTVGWIDNNTFATANEGDYEDADGVQGGSRGFTVFHKNGTVTYDSGESFEYEQIRAGHYNEGRSENKGGEPEALEIAKFGGRTLLFVGAERTNVLGVYDVSRGAPQFLQLLPTGIGPEGVKAIPTRNIVAVAAETSVDDIFPSMITLYEERKGAPPSMQLVSADVAGLPIPWVAMSGLVGDPTDPNTLYGVSDSILAHAGIFTIDVSASPAVITKRVLVTNPDGPDPDLDPDLDLDLDLEGIAIAPEGGFWLASEGRTNAGSTRPNLLLRVDANGVVQERVALPDELLAAGLTSSGFEGLAATGTDGTTEYVYVVIQRGWPGDPTGTVKIGRYAVAGDEWTFVSYTLDAAPAGGFVGLSEITELPDGTFAIIERDNQAGTAATVKKVYGVDLATADFKSFGNPLSLAVVGKTLLADVLDEIDANSIWTPDKLEGLAVAADGDVYIVTDNDGLDEAIGQTVFLNLGPVATALAG